MKQSIEDQFDGYNLGATYNLLPMTVKDKFKKKMFAKFQGCEHTCPVCKTPCQLNSGHDGLHSSKCHRIAGVSGEYEINTGYLLSHVDCNIMFRDGWTRHVTEDGVKKQIAYKEFANEPYKWQLDETVYDDSLKFWQWYINYYKTELLEKEGRSQYSKSLDGFDQYKLAAQRYVDEFTSH